MEEKKEEKIEEEEKKEVLEHLASLIAIKKKREEKMINPFLRKKIASIKRQKKIRKGNDFPIITTSYDVLKQQEDALQGRLNRMFEDKDEK